MALNAGFGKFSFVDPSAGNETLWVSRILSAEFSEEITSENSQAYPSFSTGPLENVDTVTTERTVTLTVEIESVDKMDWSLILNRYQNTGNITVPEFVSVTVPSAAPYTVAVTGLTLDQVVYATAISTLGDGNTELTQIDTADVATIAAGEYAVAADEITFDAAQAGATVGIYYDVAKTAFAHYGGATQNELGNLRFTMGVESTRQNNTLIFSFANVRRSSGVAISTGTDAFSLEYQALLPAGAAEVFTAYEQV